VSGGAPNDRKAMGYWLFHYPLFCQSAADSAAVDSAEDAALTLSVLAEDDLLNSDRLVMSSFMREVVAPGVK
jgi:hypothetical protein